MVLGFSRKRYPHQELTPKKTSIPYLETKSNKRLLAQSEYVNLDSPEWDDSFNLSEFGGDPYDNGMRRRSDSRSPSLGRGISLPPPGHRRVRRRRRTAYDEVDVGYDESDRRRRRRRRVVRSRSPPNNYSRDDARARSRSNHKWPWNSSRGLWKEDYDRRDYDTRRNDDGDRRDYDSRRKDDGEKRGKMTFWVAHSDCARIIGKGGVELKRIEHRSGCKVHLQPVHEMASNLHEAERWVEVVGEKRSHQKCFYMLLELAEFCRDADGQILKDERPTSNTDEVIVLHVPQEDVGQILGRGGENAQKIQQDSFTRITVDKSTGIVEIYGLEANQEKALEMILEEVSYCKTKDGRILKDNPDISEKLVLHVPTEDIPRMLGRGGENAEKIKRESKTKLQVDKAAGKVEIFGLKGAQQNALNMILEYVSYCRTDDGRVLKDDGCTLDSNDSMVLHVPPEDIGKILGRGGENAQKIKKETTTKLKVDKFGGRVEIFGLKTNQENALEMILEEVSYCRTDDGRVLKDEGCALNSNEVMVVYVRQEEFGKVLGRGGENAERIKKESTTKLAVDKSTGKVEIFGLQSNREKALEMILEDISYCTTDKGRVLKNTLRWQNGESRSQPMKLWVDHRECGKLIGRGGETIMGIMKKSHCDLRIQDFEDSDGIERMVEVFGTPEDQYAAMQLIMEEVSSCRTDPAGSQAIIAVEGSTQNQLANENGNWQYYNANDNGSWQYQNDSNDNGSWQYHDDSHKDWKIAEFADSNTAGAWICRNCGGDHRSRECPHSNGSWGASAQMGLVGVSPMGGVMSLPGAGMPSMTGVFQYGMPVVPMFCTLPVKNSRSSSSSSDSSVASQTGKDTKGDKSPTTIKFECQDTQSLSSSSNAGAAVKAGKNAKRKKGSKRKTIKIEDGDI